MKKCQYIIVLSMILYFLFHSNIVLCESKNDDSNQVNAGDIIVISCMGDGILTEKSTLIVQSDSLHQIEIDSIQKNNGFLPFNTGGDVFLDNSQYKLLEKALLSYSYHDSINMNTNTINIAIIRQQKLILNQYIELSRDYNEFINEIKKVLEKSNADKIHHFLYDYIYYIDRE